MVIASDVTVNSNFGYVNLIVTEAHRVPPSANENAKKKKRPNRAPWYTPKRITPERQIS
jgi:hypothetical protein